MGLWQRLHEFYDYKDKYEQDPNKKPIAIGFMEQTIHIDMRISRESKCVAANVCDKTQKMLMPVTPSSQSRTSKVEAHLLFDTLEYLAKDLSGYVAKEERLKEKYKDKLDKSNNWIAYLQSRQSVSYDRDKVLSYLQTVLTYIQNEQMVGDLIAHEIQFVDEGGMLIGKNKEGNKSELAKVLPDVGRPFIHFQVEGIENGDRMELDPDFIQATQDYLNAHIVRDIDVDYISGIQTKVTGLHQKGLRSGGDKAKLISSNDETNFTYRGRFRADTEADTVGYEMSEKAHNALRYLIRTQGFNSDGRIFLVFGTKDIDLSGAYGFFSFRVRGEPEESMVEHTTYRREAEEVIKALKGYQTNITAVDEKVVVAILDAATPGRLSLIYYQEFDRADFLEKILLWHEQLKWEFMDKESGYRVTRAPLPSELIFSCYGLRVDDKLEKNAHERIFRCIINGEMLPSDMRKTLLRQASRSEQDAWKRIVACACSVFRQYYLRTEGKEYSMALDRNCRERDYLFGRLLALAEALENYAVWLNTGENNKRGTHAQRKMTSFMHNPYRTWSLINSLLQPYKLILQKHGRTYYENEINEILSVFDPAEFEMKKSLEGKYLLGYAAQLADIRQRKEAARVKQEEIE